MIEQKEGKLPMKEADKGCEALMVRCLDAYAWSKCEQMEYALRKSAFNCDTCVSIESQRMCFYKKPRP